MGLPDPDFARPLPQQHARGACRGSARRRWEAAATRHAPSSEPFQRRARPGERPDSRGRWRHADATTGTCEAVDRAARGRVPEGRGEGPARGTAQVTAAVGGAPWPGAVPRAGARGGIREAASGSRSRAQPPRLSQPSRRPCHPLPSRPSPPPCPSEPPRRQRPAASRPAHRSCPPASAPAPSALAASHPPASAPPPAAASPGVVCPTRPDHAPGYPWVTRAMVRMYILHLFP